MRPLEDVLWEWGPLRRLWKPLFRRVVTGRWEPFVMRPIPAEPPRDLPSLGLYLHVPFCVQTCPFCPYHRFPYDRDRYARFETAVHREIDRVRATLSTVPAISSLYVGGGTPTVDPAALGRLVTHMRDAFGPAAETCVEMHPAAMDDACLDVLLDLGVTMLSVGVESLSDDMLTAIGRSHDAATAVDAVRRGVARGFPTVNADLMFALPGQTLEAFDDDVQRVLALGIHQLSTYPLFGFPYTELGENRRLTRIERPSAPLIRAMLDRVRGRAAEHGMKRCAIWSFVRPGHRKFSSITRHHYLGFGPSAASMTGGQFRVNTFDLDAFEDADERAIGMPFPARLEMAYWLYWRVYEMWLPRESFRGLFGCDIEDVFGSLLRVCCRLGLLQRADDGYVVTERASYAIHRLQNEYSLNAINRLWGTCRREAWPAQVRL